MNKRRKAQVFSLMLAFLMLASVVPGTFLKPVSATGYITGVSAETNYGDSLLFNGFPYYVNVTINASQNTFANITMYYVYNNGSSVVVYSRIKPVYSGQNTVLINSSNPVDIASEYENIPQNVNSVILQVWESVWNGNGYSNIGTPVQYNFTVRPPFTVSIQNIKSDVPYNSSGTWMNDKIFEYIPFNMTVNVTYDPYLVNNSLVSVPSSQNVSIILPNGTVKVVTVDINGTTEANLTQNNTGAVEIRIDPGINVSGDIAVNSTGGTYTYSDSSAATVNPWWIEETHWVVPQGANSTSPYKYVSFDLYTNVTTMSDFGVLGINDSATVTVNSDVLGGSNSSSIVNGTGQVVVTGLKVDPATATVNLASYPVNTSFTITGTPWNIYISNYAVYYTGKTQNASVFYINVPSILNVTVQYNLTVALNSTANYTIYLNGNKVTNGTFHVINNVGTFEVPLTPDELGNITVVVNDTTYHVSTSLTIPVEDWNVTGAYKVYHYGTYEDRQFYIGIPADLYVNATFGLPILLNSSVVVEVYAPNGTLVQNTTLTITNNTGEGIVLTNVAFNQIGYVVVKIYNSTYDVMDTLRIPVKDWGIYVDSTPKELTAGTSTPLTVEVRESLYFPGNEPVNVKLYLPDGQVLSENVTLQGSSYTANGGYYGVLTFTDVNSTLPGLAKVVITDLTFGKTAIKYLPVYPNGNVTGKWIDVQVTPEKSPVYAYVNNSFNIALQYYYNVGDGAYKDSVNSYANVTIIDASGNVVYSNVVGVRDGFVRLTNVTFPIGDENFYVEVTDTINGTIRGVAEITVEPWTVNVEFSPTETYMYVPTTVTVTATPSVAGIGPLEVYVNGNLYTGPISLPDPTSDTDYNIVVYYNGHVMYNETKTLTVLPWNVTITPSQTWAYKYVPTQIDFTVTPTVDTISAGDLVVKIDGSTSDSITVELTDNETHTVEVYYNGHLIKSETFTIAVKDWHVELVPNLASGRNYLYQYVPDEVTIKAIPVDDSGNEVPVDIALNVTYMLNGNITTATGTNSVTIPVEDDDGVGLYFFVDAYYGTHMMTNFSEIDIPTHTWSIEVAQDTDSAWVGVPTTITFSVETYDDVTGEQISLPLDIPITVTYNGDNYTGNNSVTVPFTAPTAGSFAFEVTAAYNEIVYSESHYVTAKDWGVYVNAYPGKLYRNLPQDLTLIIGYSAGISDVATVTVENGDQNTTAQVNVVPVGENSAIGVVDLGQITPTGDYVKVKVDTGYGKSTLLKIPVISWNIAVVPKVTFVYTNVSTDITVDVHYSDSMLDGQATVFLKLPNGTILTQQATITDGQGSATFAGVVSDVAGNITVYAADVASGEMSPEETIPVHDWHMEMSLSPTEWYTYMPQDYTVNVTYIDDVTGGIADISGTDTVAYNLTGVVGTDAITVTDGQGSVTLENLATENAGTATFTVIDDAHGKSVEKTATIHAWKVVVTYPEKLYVAPGYENPIQVGFEYIADNNETVPYTGNTTITINLPENNVTLTANVNASPVDFGTFELNTTETGTITVYANDYPAISMTGNITVENLLTLNVTTKELYEGVPSTVVANIVYNGGDYHNLNVYIEGQNITLTTDDGVTWTADVTLPAGNYTVVAYDTVYNVTMTDTFHVAPWHVEITPSTTGFPAGTIVPVNFTVVAINDETNETADINTQVNLSITFSNPAIIPNGTYVVDAENMVHGVATFTNVELFAPAPGNFTIVASLPEYGRAAETTVSVEAPTKPPTYVYINIYKEGTLEAPNDTVVIYWSVDGEHYFPAYNRETGSIVEVDTALSTRTVFPVYPTESFSLYVIAVPKFIAEKYPVILMGNMINATHSTPSVWREYNVTSANGTITASVTVYKKVVTEGWTYQPPAAPGYVAIHPPASVYAVAPYTPYNLVRTEVMYNATNSTSYTFTFTPTKYIELTKLTDMNIKPAQNGEYFEFEARLYMKYLNISGQFDEQFQTFEENVQDMVNSLPYLNDTAKEALAQEIIADAQGYKSDITGAYSANPTPISGEEIQFHIDNPAIAYLEPANATTDENGTIRFKVYSAAPAGAAPEELVNYMGDVTVWATYDNMTTESYTVSFGGVGSISGDVVDPNNNLLPGAVVELQKKEGDEWVTATDYAGNELKTTADGKGHYSFGNVPAALNGTAYRVVATYGDGTGYADTTVYPFKTSTADVVVTGYNPAELTGLATFVSDAQTHNVMIVTGNNPLHTADYQAMSFIMTLIGVQPAYTDNEINISNLNSNDMVIAVGGPLVNSITAYYQDLGEAKMVTNADGSISVVVGNETVANWTAPAVWWNVTEGYWIIQKVVDPNTNATVYMIYGTDADSTWAASYYFSQHFAELQGKNYVVGYWKDTDHVIYSPAFLKFSSDDTNGFSPTDDMGIVVEG